MITHIMKSKLHNAAAAAFYSFMVDPPREIYARWLPEEHHKFHVVKRSETTPVGDLIFFDQHIGSKHRLTFYAITRVADKPNHVLFQMRRFGINLPGYLDLQFRDTADGLCLTETIRIGFNGSGKVLDPIIKLFFNKSFFNEMNAHHKREWANLAEILRQGKSDGN
ncbi:MAG: hypothetical protein LBR74_00370 [Eubacterium sp.]|jgi:hypothetical protein|nr:hypothetical protein [Eubacterium sp.]